MMSTKPKDAQNNNYTIKCQTCLEKNTRQKRLLFVIFAGLLVIDLGHMLAESTKHYNHTHSNIISTL